MSEQSAGTRHLAVGRDGPVVTLVLDRPDRRNPLSRAAMAELRAALVAAGDDPGVRAVVIGATGPVFCAGHDLRELQAADAQATAANSPGMGRPCVSSTSAFTEVLRPPSVKPE